MLVALSLFLFSFIHVDSSNTATAAAGINHQINFQGKLVNPNGTNVTDGSYSIVYSIYSVSSGGSAIWTETQTVTLSKGIFQVNLGSVTALPGSIDFNTDNIYLGIKVGADAEMTPRVQFTAVPQAFNSEKLNGLASSAFAQLAATQTFTGANTFQPTTNITGLKILQNSSGSFGTDVFNVQGSSGGANNFIQITSTAANQGAVTIASLGANNLNLNSGSNTVSVGATNITGTGALTVAAAAGQILDLESGSTANLNVGVSANNKTVNIGAVGATANTTTVNIATSTGAAQTVNIGSSASGSLVSIAGDLTNGNRVQRSLTRTLPTTVNDEVDIGSFALSNGGGNFEISVVVPNSGFSVTKQYMLPIQYNQTTNTWVIAQPISDSGPYSTNDFALDVNVNVGTTSFRLRRVAGATAGTAYVTIVQKGVNTDAFTASAATSSVAAPTTYLSDAFTTQTGGILKVMGSATLTGTLGATSSTTGYEGTLYNTNTSGTASGLSVRIDQNTATNIALNVQAGAGTNLLQVLGTGAVKLGAAAVGNLQLLNDGGTNTTGLLFGSANDANLYRSTSNTLKTDGSLIVANATGNGVSSTATNSAANTQPYAYSGVLNDTSTSASSTGNKYAAQFVFNKNGSAVDTGFAGGAAQITSNINAGTLPDLWNTSSRMQLASGGTVTRAYDFVADAQYGSGGAVGTRAGLNVRDWNKTGTQTLTNQYGILIDNLTSGTSNYSIYTGSAQTYLGGNLTVAGTTAFTGGITVGTRDGSFTYSTLDGLRISGDDTSNTLWNGTKAIVISADSGNNVSLCATSNCTNGLTVVTATGQVLLPATGSTAGLLIGGDANLYRLAASTLKTDGALTVGTNLVANTSASVGSANQTKIDGNGNVDAIGSVSTPNGGVGKFQNLVANSETIGGTGWGCGGSLVCTQNATASPDGGTTGSQITQNGVTSNSYASYVFTNTVSGAYTISVWAKAGNVSNISYGIFDFTASSWLAQPTVALGSGWQRVTATGTPAATGHSIGLLIYVNSSGNVTPGTYIYTWGAQAVAGSDPLVYTKTAGTANTTLQGGVASNGNILVSSNASIGGTLTVTGTTTLNSPVTINVASAAAALSINNTSVSKQWQLYPVTNGSNSDLRFWEQNTGGNADRLTLQAGGNVGIGTTAPSKKLDVQGGAQFGSGGMTSGSVVDIGNVGVDYQANSGWAGTFNANLLLSGLDYTTIGFHDAGTSVGALGYHNNQFFFDGSQSWGPVKLGINKRSPTYTIDSSGDISSDTALRSSGILSVATTSTLTGNVQVGSYAAQSTALLSVVNPGNDIEFGHNNTAGYHSTIGAEVNSGRPFLAFSSEAGTTVNTYRTRGIAGTVIQGDLAGGLLIGKAATSTADNQALTNLLTLSGSGNLTVTNSISGNYLTLVNNRLEEYATNGSAEVAVNYDGYAGGTTQFRSLTVYNGKQSIIGQFDGASGQLRLQTSGSAAGILIGNDTTLYRNAANSLQTGSTLVFSNNTQTAPAVQSAGAFTWNMSGGQGEVDFWNLWTGGGSAAFNFYQRTGTQTLLATLNQVGQFQLPVVGSTGGLLLGGDTNLYRSAANTLKTDQALIVGKSANVNSSATAGVGYLTVDAAAANQSAIQFAEAGVLQWQFGRQGNDEIFLYDVAHTKDIIETLSGDLYLQPSSGITQLGSNTTTSAGGVRFGTDTNLYRSAAGTLKTDGTVQANAIIDAKGARNVLGGLTATYTGTWNSTGQPTTGDNTYASIAASNTGTIEWTLDAEGQWAINGTGATLNLAGYWRPGDTGTNTVNLEFYNSNTSSWVNARTLTNPSGMYDITNPIVYNNPPWISKVRMNVTANSTNYFRFSNIELWAKANPYGYISSNSSAQRLWSDQLGVGYNTLLGSTKSAFNGNVGIGTNNAGYLLTVAGNAFANQFISTNASGSSTLYSNQTGDGSYRWTMLGNGTQYWGSGTGAGDVTLARNGVGGLTLQSTTNSLTGFSVLNSSSKKIFNIDTSGSQVLLGNAGASGVDGKLVFNNATNANTISLVSGATSSSYSLTLPTTGPAVSQCLQSDSATASQLKFASCTGTLQGGYTSSTGGTTSEIILDTTRNGLDIQDRSTSNGGTIGGGVNLLTVRGTAANDSTAGAVLFSVNNAGAGTFSGTLGVSGSTTLSSGGQALTLSGASSNYIYYANNGLGTPTFTSRVAGTKIVLWDGLGGSSADYGVGMASNTLWMSVPSTGQQFQWYGGTTLAATLSGAGALTIAGNLVSSGTGNFGGAIIGFGINEGFYFDSTNVAIRMRNVGGSSLYIQNYGGTASYAIFSSSGLNVLPGSLTVGNGSSGTIHLFGSTVYDTGTNLHLGASATFADGTFQSGDINTNRGNSSGAIFLGDQSGGGRYLYYDGTNYIFPTAVVAVNRLSTGLTAGGPYQLVCRDTTFGSLNDCSSSQAYKHDITAFSDSDYSNVLQKITNTNIYNYQFNGDPNNVQHYGIISEHTPTELTYTDQNGHPIPDWFSVTGYLWAGERALSQNATALANQVAINQSINIQQGADANLTNLDVQTATVNNLNISGASQLNSLNVSGAASLLNLSVTGATSLQDLTVAGSASIASLSVSGSATISTLHVTQVATFDTDIVVGGHVITAGDTPSVQTQANAGTGALVTITGNDTLGTITIQTGNNPTAGELAKLVYKKDYGTAPKVLISPANDMASQVHFYRGTTSVHDFGLNFSDVPAPNTTYQFDYYSAQ